MSNCKARLSYLARPEQQAARSLRQRPVIAARTGPALECMRRQPLRRPISERCVDRLMTSSSPFLVFGAASGTVTRSLSKHPTYFGNASWQSGMTDFPVLLHAVLLGVRPEPFPSGPCSRNKQSCRLNSHKRTDYRPNGNFGGGAGRRGVDAGHTGF